MQCVCYSCHKMSSKDIDVPFLSAEERIIVAEHVEVEKYYAVYDSYSSGDNSGNQFAGDSRVYFR